MLGSLSPQVHASMFLLPTRKFKSIRLRVASNENIHTEFHENQSLIQWMKGEGDKT